MLKKLVGVYDMATITIAAFAFATPMFMSDSTKRIDSAGVYAALIALCMGALILVESLHWEGPLSRWRRPAIGICALGSAYLWLANEGEYDPAGLTLLAEIGILFAAVGVLLIWPIFIMVFDNLWGGNPRR